MTSNEKSTMVVGNEFKQLTCQATLCVWQHTPATCTADYLELDDHGICIHFDRREEESISPKTDERHNQEIDKDTD